MGELFICLDAPEDIIKSLIQRAGKAFYNSQLKDNVEQRFRDSLRALNELISSSLEKNIAIGLVAIYDQSIYYASCNDCQIILYRGGKATNLANGQETKFSQTGIGQIKDADSLIIFHGDLPKQTVSDIFDSLKEGAGDAFQNKTYELSKKAGINSLSLISIWLNSGITHNDQHKSNHGKLIAKKESTSLVSKLTGKLQVLARRASKIMRKLKREYAPSFLNASKKWWTNTWTRYVNPNPKQAFIVVVITTIIIFITCWAIFSNVKSTSNSEKALVNAQILIDSAEKAESNNNLDSAKQYLSQASSLLNSISKSDQTLLNNQYSSKKIKISYAGQLTRLQSILDKTQFVKRIPETNSFDIGISNLAYMYYLSSKLLAVDKNNDTLVEINPLFGAPTVKSSSPELKTALAVAPTAENLLILTPTNILQYDGSPNLTQLKLSVALPQSTAIDTYLNFVYLLSPNENQVVRFSKSGSSLSSRTNLLKNVGPSKLNGTASMVVFGNIFIPKNNNILVFEQGEERTFKLKDMPESFGGIKSLAYNPTKNYFIALNTQSNRLAILQLDSDSASFKNSFALQNDANISSFAIDDKTSQIFVNSGSKLYSFNLEKM